MSAPIYLNKSTKTVQAGSAGVPATLNMPYMGSILAGDQLYICALIQHPGATLGSLTAPSGFSGTGINGSFNDSSPAYAGNMSVYERTADGTESGTVAIGGFSNVAFTMTAQMYQFRSTPSGKKILIATSAVKTNSDGNSTMTWNTLTLNGGGRTLLAFQAGDHTGSPAITGYTLQVDDGEILLFDKEDVATDGSVTSAGGGANGYATAHVAIYSPAGRNQILN